MFSLTKWYLDCVEDHQGPDASAWILYWARLNLGPLSLSYASVIHASPVHATSETRSFGLQPPPQFQSAPGTLTAAIDLRSLRAKGTWSQDRAAHSITSKLYETHDGSVTWNAHLPHARVDLEIAGRHISGHGYAESLELTIAPWKLPIDTLRWGRLIAGDHHAVWINWEGSAPRTDLWLDGVHYPQAIFTDDAVNAGTITITHAPICTIRKGPLGTNVLDSIPLLRGVVPPRMRSAHEDKQFSTSVLELNGIHHAGHSIHETIRFGGTT